MFKILDGRTCFYQWDLEQKLVVEDTSITQVHFCNKTGDCSLVCEVYELDGLRVADVPNILLQSAWDIRAYAYQENHTKVEERFKVAARSKPADYIYTETEVLNYETVLGIAEEAKQIAQGVETAAANGELEFNLTEADKQEITQLVLAELNNGDEVSY